ncbi:MAG: peroxiredoxin family protein [Spirochaetota bacterium]|nr:peroxiredoxin family protein [Spirochaetota bacterium]
MNLLKSIYIVLYVSAANFFGFYSIYKFLDTGYDLAWLGAAISAGPGGWLISFLMLTRMIPRTSASLYPITIMAVAGFGLAFYSHIQNDHVIVLPFILSLGGLIAWLLYAHWYSVLSRGENPILELGKKLPHFELKNQHGETVSSDSFSGSFALFLFFRGNWCPLCMAQIKEIAGLYHKLAEKGVSINLISPQSQKHTESLASHFDLPFNFLVDEDNEVARQLGIIHKNGVPVGMQVLGYESDTVLPTVIITDSSSEIIFADLTDNYRLRPEPSTFLEIIDRKS